MHPADVDFWVLAPNDVPTSPIPLEGDIVANREVQYFQAVARLRPDVTTGACESRFQAIAERTAREFPIPIRAKGPSRFRSRRVSSATCGRRTARSPWRRRLRAADCMCQRREPAPGARGRSAPRARGSNSLGCRTGPPDPTTTDRKPRARRRGAASSGCWSRTGESRRWSRLPRNRFQDCRTFNWIRAWLCLPWLVSAAVGVLFGIFPAFQGARLDPVSR